MAHDRFFLLEKVFVDDLKGSQNIMDRVQNGADTLYQQR